MRFEIRAGGVFVILIGLVVLSGAVFFLGVMAGNEIAKQNTPDQSQISSMFPLPSPPAMAPTPTPAPLAALNPPPAPALAPAVAPHTSALPPIAASSRAASIATVRAAAPANTRAVASASTPAAITAPPTHKHPFNIQIEAVMDRDGADQMVRRLQALGYPAAAETTDIDGQTWYRVKVGPYQSQEEAQEAQDKLRAAYKAQYLRP
jgi:septal ring-binding cell division protein DamX